ncbi:MAG: S8 family serine peptidase [Verrucomicrobiota bacterium JB023]|nr:S8 family serine peptidase [Verrucomicrobiota bacterium JB023]
MNNASKYFTLLWMASCLALSAQDDEIEEIRSEMPRVTLNQVVYEKGETISVQMRLREASQANDVRPAVVLASEQSGDVELIELKESLEPLVYYGVGSVTIGEVDGDLAKADGVLSLAPGEVFSAMVSYRIKKGAQSGGSDSLAADWGMRNDANASAEVSVVENAVLSADELDLPEGSRPFGTLFLEGEPGPVQVASNELLFLPNSEQQYEQFVERTGAVVLGFLGSMEEKPEQLPKAGTAWLRMQMAGDPAKIAELPALRTLFGKEDKLRASNEETLALVATATELWCEGYAVGLNPRLMMHERLQSPEGEIDHYEDGVLTYTSRIDAYGNFGDENPENISDPFYGIRRMWALLSMFDYDQNSIPVGVIDSGFAPNRDFKTGHPLYGERNLSNGTSGIGSAQTAQEVGNSFFGEKTWHGNGTVTTISGAPSNYYGHRGVAGQTAVPKLYHMGLANFAFGFGTAINLALDDGCSIINISAGYPCRVLSVLGNDSICSPGDRAVFMTKLGLAVRAAAAAACAASGLLDAFLPGLGTAVCASSIVAAETAALAFFSTTFLGETRGPVETAVARATSMGVPITASAGNNLDGGVDEPLASLVDLDNTNIDDWQIIPAVIPEVIGVGNSEQRNSATWGPFDGGFDNLAHRANIHFWGEGVDIWAPGGSIYWAPESGTADPATVPESDHISRTFGATSNAAPYVAGVIANMMAVDRSLDRRFANPAALPSLVDRIRDHLLDTAYLAGDPGVPDSADDVVTLGYNFETETYEEIEEPPALLDQMERRRNLVNPLAAVERALSDVGLPDYASLGYDLDLGMNDDFFDSAPPSEVREPVMSSFPFSASDELNERDREFWFLEVPPNSWLYEHTIEATIPAREDATLFHVNGVPGTPVSATGTERTLQWQLAPRWAAGESLFVPLSISGGGPFADSLYKLGVTRRTLPPPEADDYDRGLASNETLDEAVTFSDWVSVTPSGSLEVSAFELCIEELSFHHPADVDVFEIEFPEPPLNLPSVCSSLNPWVTVRVEPPSAVQLIEVLSRSGGSDTLLARGSGDGVVRLDCRDYLGRLPLFVRVSSPSQAAVADYDLKVRWSEPSEDLNNRLDRIRDAHAGRQAPPHFEQLFPPEIPWLLTSPGSLRPELVNPNPVFEQELGANGEFLASRLFFFEIEEGDFNVDLQAVVPLGQSLRMEVVDPSSEFVYDATGTPDLGFGLETKDLNGDMLSLEVSLDGYNPGVFILRLSGHSPGDQISLYLSNDLVPPGALSIETLLGQGQGVPVELPPLPGFGVGHRLMTSSPELPELPSGQLVLERAREVSFEAQAGGRYQIEILGEDGIWERYGAPIGEEQQQRVTRYFPMSRLAADGVRVTKMGEGESFPPEEVGPAFRLAYQSIEGAPTTLYTSTDLETFEPADESFLGDGMLREWFFPYPDETSERMEFGRMQHP